MSEVILFGQPIASWVIPAATFVFGLACGWLGWSGRNGDEKSEEDASARVRAKAERLNIHAADTAEDNPEFDTALRTENGTAPGAVDAERPTLDPVQLQALELELRKAREALEAAEDNDAGLADEIKALDDAVNRANGRLKIVARSVRKIINKS